MTTLTDPHDPDYSLHMNVTTDPNMVEVRASDGLRSLTLDVRFDELLAAVNEARTIARLMA